MSAKSTTCIKKKTLKNGEVKEYVCTVRYTAKTNRKSNIGKEIARKKIAECNDKEKIDKIYEYMCEIGM